MVFLYSTNLVHLKEVAYSAGSSSLSWHFVLQNHKSYKCVHPFNLINQTKTCIPKLLLMLGILLNNFVNQDTYPCMTKAFSYLIVDDSALKAVFWTHGILRFRLTNPTSELSFKIKLPSQGNLDEKVSEKVLYEILIQVGRLVDLHIPRDKDTNRHKGYAFAEYETEEIANYAVKLFSGIVRLHNKILRFGMSGQDKTPSSQSNGTPVTPRQITSPITRPPVYPQGTLSQGIAHPLDNFRAPPGTSSVSPVYFQAPPQLSSSFEYSRRVFGAMLNNVSRPGARQPIAYPSY